MLIEDDLTDMVGSDRTMMRVFDTDDIAVDGSGHIAVLKRKVRAFHFAVFQHQTFAVAQRLSTDDLAADEAQVFAIPCQIFALDDRTKAMEEYREWYRSQEDETEIKGIKV